MNVLKLTWIVPHKRLSKLQDSSLPCVLSQGNTPLHLAAANYRMAAVELLLASNADPEFQNKEGKTALGLARTGPVVHRVSDLSGHCSLISQWCLRISTDECSAHLRNVPVEEWGWDLNVHGCSSLDVSRLCLTVEGSRQMN